MVFVVCMSIFLDCHQGSEQYEDKPENEGWRCEDGTWWCPSCIARDRERIVESIAWGD